MKNPKKLYYLYHNNNYATITHEEIANLLKDEVSNVNAKISYMVKQGILIRLKKGLYVFSELYRDGSVMLNILNNTPEVESPLFPCSHRLGGNTYENMYSKKAYNLSIANI